MGRWRVAATQSSLAHSLACGMHRRALSFIAIAVDHPRCAARLSSAQTLASIGDAPPCAAATCQNISRIGPVAPRATLPPLPILLPSLHCRQQCTSATSAYCSCRCARSICRCSTRACTSSRRPGERRRRSPLGCSPLHPTCPTSPPRFHSFEEHEPAAHELEEHWHAVPPPIVVRSAAAARGAQAVLRHVVPCSPAACASRPRILARGIFIPQPAHTAPPILPAPSQADLNGDGKPEIVTATPSGRLQILAPRRFGDGFAQAEVRRGEGLGRCSESRGSACCHHCRSVPF